MFSHFQAHQFSDWPAAPMVSSMAMNSAQTPRRRAWQRIRIGSIGGTGWVLLKYQILSNNTPIRLTVDSKVSWDIYLLMTHFPFTTGIFKSNNF